MSLLICFGLAGPLQYSALIVKEMGQTGLMQRRLQWLCAGCVTGTTFLKTVHCHNVLY